MFVPYGTDAPIYHWPFATVAIIVLNIIAFPIQMSLPDERVGQSYLDVSDEEIDDMSDQELEFLAVRLMSESEPGWYKYALSHGDGLHPVQWMTSFFMHGNFGHLLGNMLFLWAFGIVIEGKIGPWMFSFLYFAMGIFRNLAEQVVYLGMELPPSLGASGVIYSLMVMAMIWSPKDNLLCVTVILLIPIFFSFPVLLLSFLYLFLDFGVVLFSGFELSSAMLHMMGGLVGLFPAMYMLNKNLVDCEHHDIFSLFREAAGKELKPRTKTPQQQRNAEQERAELVKSIEEKEQQFKKSIAAHLAANNVTAAEKLMTNYRRRGGSSNWTGSQLLQLIKTYQAKQEWNRVIPLSLQYLERFVDNAPAIRINLAKVYLLQKEAPRKAMRELQQLKMNELSEKQKQTVQRIATQARQQIDEGTIELGDDEDY